MATVNIILLRQKKKKNGRLPVVLRVTHNRQRKYYSLGYESSEEEWNAEHEIFQTSVYSYHRKNRVLFNKRFKAEDIIREFEREEIKWNFTDFKKQFVAIKSIDVFEYFDEVIEIYESNDQYGTADCFSNTKRALKKFHGNKPLKFSRINYAFLSKFELFLRMRGVEGGLLSVMHPIRGLFNRAIKNKLCPKRFYPFKEYQLSKLKTTPAKRAISRNEINQIIAYQAAPFSEELFAKHIFVFSFYNQGMNFKDIAHLRWSDIQCNRVRYSRSKTKRKYTIKIQEPVQAILDYYKIHNPPGVYVFPILNDSINNKKVIYKRCNSMLVKVNTSLKAIGKKLKIQIPLTTYVARHSYATILKEAGVSIVVISEGLGHSTELMTQTYLKRFNNEVLDRANELLLYE